MHQFSSKENFLIANTLSCIPLLLHSHAVIIDLRNETTVAGRIDNADGYMNVHLTEAVFIDRMGKQYPFEHFMVRERMIRQIHLPADIDMNKQIRNWCKAGCLRTLKKPQKTKRTFKQKRAQEKHKEILNQLAEQRNEEATNLK